MRNRRGPAFPLSFGSILKAPKSSPPRAPIFLLTPHAVAHFEKLMKLLGRYGGEFGAVQLRFTELRRDAGIGKCDSDGKLRLEKEKWETVMRQKVRRMEGTGNRLFCLESRKVAGEVAGLQYWFEALREQRQKIGQNSQTWWNIFEKGTAAGESPCAVKAPGML